MFKFIKEALSENGAPSSKRLIAFMCGVTLNFIPLFAVIWDRVHGIANGLATWFVCAFILFDLVLLGLATVPQLLEAWKGIRGIPTDKAPAVIPPTP
jgi:hypothetical protein